MKSFEIEMDTPQLPIETFIMEAPIFRPEISKFLPDSIVRGSHFLADL
jgi:hypothetical protein